MEESSKSKLRDLQIPENDILRIPKSILEQSVEASMDFLFPDIDLPIRRRRDEDIPINANNQEPKNIRIGPIMRQTQVRAPYRDTKISLVFEYNTYLLQKKVIGNHIYKNQEVWIDRYVKADHREFPGLAILEELKEHEQFLVCGLIKDETNEMTTASYIHFKRLLTKYPQHNQQYRMMVSTMYAFDKKVMQFICHQSETSGFGDVLRQYDLELGIFEIYCSYVYRREDKKNKKLRNQLRDKQKEIEFLRKGSN